MKTTVDILAIGVHPDDIELCCGATIAKEVAQGKKVAFLHLTQGELGTRGTREIRLNEAQKAAEILGVQHLDFLNLGDGFFENTMENALSIIKFIRLYTPKIVLANAIEDRHPDHARASDLISRACFLSGLPKVETEYNGSTQMAYRPHAVYHYIQWYNLRPDFVVDVTGYMDIKIAACEAYSSQFYDENTAEPPTPISTKNFKESIHYRAKDLGRIIGTAYAEGYTVERFIGVDSLMDIK